MARRVDQGEPAAPAARAGTGPGAWAGADPAARAGRDLAERGGADPAAAAKDAALGPAARTMVHRYAPHLGLDPEAVPLRVADFDHTGPLGTARGSAAADGIVLRPSAIASGDVGLLVHELAHLAQHRNRERPPSATLPETARPDQTTAEAEAAALAAAARIGAPLWHPRALLPSAHTARDTGAVGVAPRKPLHAPGAEAAAALGIDTGLLELMVRDNHADEIARIRNEAGSFWGSDEERRDTALRIIEPLRFVVARSVVKALEPEVRRRLARLSPRDHAEHPEAAIAVLAALDGADIEALDDALTRGPASALHGVDLAALDPAVPRRGAGRQAGPVVLRALFEVVRMLKQEQRVQLFKDGEKGAAFRDLMQNGPPAGSERDEITAALAEESRFEEARKQSTGSDTVVDGKTQHTTGIDEALVGNVAQILTHHTADAARDALKALVPLSDMALVAHQADRPQPPPKAGTNAPAEPGERLRAVVRELDRRELVDVILDHLPAKNRYVTAEEGAPYAAVLSAVLRARSPGFTLPRVESLLSYGLFDWAVTDDDARFAYLLVRSLPLETQDEWRRRGDSKWFHRLEDNLPESMVTGGEYTGVGSEYTPGGAEASDGDTLKLVARILKDWRGLKTPTNAMLTIEALTAEAQKAEVRTAAVRRLDTLGVVEEMIAALDDQYVVSEDGRHVLDRFFALRDPVRLLWRVSDSTWYIMTARHAWLAFLMLRSLPAAIQQNWDREHPAMWLSMQLAMTPQMRQSAALSALNGRNGVQIADVRERIAEPELWDGKHTPELRALILIAYAADDHRWVFDFSRTHADLAPMRDPEFVAGLGLYDATSRPEYVPENIQLPGTWHEIMHYAGLAGRTALYLAGAALQVVSQSFGHTLHLSADLQTVQWLGGGDALGVQFADRDKTVVGGTTEADRKLRAETNMLTLDLDPGLGAFELKLPLLRLDRLNIARPGSSYRTGPVTLRGLRVKGSFSDRHYREPIGFDADVGEADIRDLVVAGSDSGAVALARIFLDTLSFTSGATGTEDIEAVQPRAGSIPILILGPLLRAVDNIIQLWGDLPGDFTLVDFMLLPIGDLGMSWLPRKILGAGMSAGANYLVKSPAPLDYLYGLASDGALRPPRKVTERMADAIKMLRSLNLSFEDLEITGASLGAGTQVASLKLHDVSIGVARSRPAYLRALIASLDRRIAMLPPQAATALFLQRKTAVDELGTLLYAEKRLEYLERKDRWIAGSLTALERQELVRYDAMLHSDLGVTLDIGGIEVGRISGGVEMAGLTTGAVHLAARMPDAVLPGLSGSYLDDEDLAAKVGDGPRPPSAARLAKESEFEFSVAGLKVLADPEGGPAIRFPAGRIPPLDVLQQYYEDLPPTATTLRAQMIRVLVARRHLVVLEATRPAQPTPEDDRLLREARTAVRRLLGWEIGSLSVRTIGGALDPQAGTVGVAVTGIEAHDVVGAKFAAGTVTGDVTVGADLTALSGDFRALNGRDALNAGGPKFRAGLDLKQVETPSGVARGAHVGGLTGTVELVPGGVRVRDLGLETLELDTLNLSTATSTIIADKASVSGVTADVTYTSVTRPDGVEVTRLDVPTLHIREIKAQDLGYTSQDGKSKIEVSLSQGRLGDITGSGLFYEATGDWDSRMGGDVGFGAADLQLKIVRTLLQVKGRPTTTVTGKVEGQAGVGRSVLTVGFAVDKHGKKTTYSATVDADGLAAVDTTVAAKDLAVTVRRLPMDGHAVLDNAGIAGDLTLTNVDIGAVNWHSGTSSVTSVGGTRLDSVALRAAYTYGVPAEGDKAALPPVLRITQCDIFGIDAADLRYRDTDAKSPLDVQLGRTASHPGALHVSSLKLSGIALPFTADGDLMGARTAFHADVTGLHVDGRVVLGALSAAGRVDAESLAVGFAEGGGRITARGRGVSGDADVEYDAAKVPGGLPAGKDPLRAKAHAAFSGLDTGAITVTKEAVVVDGLSLPDLTIDRLDVIAGKTGDTLRAWTQPGGKVRLTGTTATVRVDRATQAITFEKLAVPTLTADEIRADIDGLGVFYAPPPHLGAGTRGATLENITADGLTLDKDWKASGTVTVDRSTVPALRAEVLGVFTGDVRLDAGKITLDVAANAVTKAVVDHPHGAILGRAGLAGTQTLQLGGLGADSVTYRPTTGPGGKKDFTVDVDNGAVSGLVFEDGAGLKVEVAAGNLPGTVTAHKLSGHIPKLTLTDAQVTMDLTKGGSGGAGPEFTPGLKDLVISLLDHLNGGVPLKVIIRALPLVSGVGPVDIGMAVDVAASGGVVDFDDVLAQAERTLAFSPPIPGVRGAARSLLRWDLSGDTAALQLHANIPIPVPPFVVPISRNIIWWDLAGAKDVALFRSTHHMRVPTVINDFERRGGGGGGGGPAAIDVEIGSGAHLDIDNPAPVRVDVSVPAGSPATGPSGHFTLSRNVAKGIGLEGTLRPIGASPAPGLLSRITLEHFGVDEVDLKLAGGAGVSTRGIEVTGVRDGKLVMDGVTPKWLYLRVSGGEANDVDWTLP